MFLAGQLHGEASSHAAVMNSRLRAVLFSAVMSTKPRPRYATYQTCSRRFYGCFRFAVNSVREAGRSSATLPSAG